MDGYLAYDLGIGRRLPEHHLSRESGMKLQELGWYELGVRDFLARISGIGPTEPPGAMGVVAMALAGSAALLSKATADPELASTLEGIVDEVLHVAVRHGHAFLRCRTGTSSPKVIEPFHCDVVTLAERVVQIGETMPTTALTDQADLAVAKALAAGCLAAVTAIRNGNTRIKR